MLCWVQLESERFYCSQVLTGGRLFRGSIIKSFIFSPSPRCALTPSPHLEDISYMFEGLLFTAKFCSPLLVCVYTSSPLTQISVTYCLVNLSFLHVCLPFFLCQLDVLLLVPSSLHFPVCLFTSCFLDIACTFYCRFQACALLGICFLSRIDFWILTSPCLHSP